MLPPLLLLLVRVQVLLEAAPEQVPNDLPLRRPPKHRRDLRSEQRAQTLEGRGEVEDRRRVQLGHVDPLRIVARQNDRALRVRGCGVVGVGVAMGMDVGMDTVAE